MEIQQKRTRINFKTTTKGVVSCDVTLEDFNKSNEEVLKEAVELLNLAMLECKKRNESYLIS